MPQQKTEFEKQLIRTVRFLESTATLEITGRFESYIEAICGNCILLAKQANNWRNVYGQQEYRKFQRISAKRGAGKKFFAYECPECKHLVDAQLAECLTEASAMELTLY